MAPNFDSNTWFQITESRVDFNTSLQVVKNAPSTLSMAAAGTDTFQYWQVFLLKNGSAILRNKAQGIGKQLGVCPAPNEVDSSKTAPCMVDTADVASQKWDILTWLSNGGNKLQNVGNGTNYNLDCHRGNPLFMSSTTAATPEQPAQHWLFSSIGVINDVTYSTAGAGQNSIHASSSTASSSPTSTSGSSPPSTESSSSSGLSPGAAAGIGVGVGVVVIAAVAFLLFFLRRRKKNKRSQPPPTYEKDANASSHQAPVGEVHQDYKYGSPPSQHGAVPFGHAYEMEGYTPASEMSDRHEPQELPAGK